MLLMHSVALFFSLWIILKSQVPMTQEQKNINQMENTGSQFATMCSDSFIPLLMWIHFHQIDIFSNVPRTQRSVVSICLFLNVIIYHIYWGL